MQHRSPLIQNVRVISYEVNTKRERYVVRGLQSPAVNSWWPCRSAGKIRFILNWHIPGNGGWGGTLDVPPLCLLPWLGISLGVFRTHHTRLCFLLPSQANCTVAYTCSLVGAPNSVPRFSPLGPLVSRHCWTLQPTGLLLNLSISGPSTFATT